ncbi:hypothetical protein [Desulfosporosinus metallidurans]|uniref:Uncharacterized protein n=1 Tax=Desulfosporosinus metallidurans TaxID=1888891 RepID=A0A1Q8QFJ6_9FIRM|nr:hypothetical protein [Desulfosporosinus metallidurans]OLN26116.1 hypothetical protein DSOL_5120 [Desulfosporosinus metallidurans]
MGKIIHLRSRLRMQATPVVKGEFAQEILSEIQKRPSPEAKKRLRKARELLRKLQK